MKNLLMLVSLAAVSLGFSSCCSMFGSHSQSNGYRTETHQVRTCGYDLVNEQVVIKGGSKSCKDGLVVTTTKQVPRYKTVTTKVRVKCGPCVRRYCPTKECCGTTSQATLSLSSNQGSSGSPGIGLIPTMKPIEKW